MQKIMNDNDKETTVDRWKNDTPNIDPLHSGADPRKAVSDCLRISKDQGHQGPLRIQFLVVKQPLWKMMEFVSWDDDIPNMMEK